MVTRKAPSPTSFYNVGAIIRFFGGRMELVRSLEKHEILNLSTSAVDKWQLRGSIPASRLLDLQTLAKAMGKEFNPRSFMNRVAPKKKAA